MNCNFKMLMMKITFVVALCVFFIPHFFASASVAGETQPKATSSTQSTIETIEKQTGVSLPPLLEKTKPKKAWSMTVGKILWGLMFFLLAFYIIRTATSLLESIAERLGNYRLSLMRIIPVVRIGFWAGTLYFIITAVFAPPFETLMALAASAGIALGFASQDILKNIFGGLMILMDRPFQVGDKIKIREHYGEVIHIGLRSVRIVTPGDSIVTVPNSDVVNQAVLNANNGESNCQVVTDIYLPVSADINRLKKIARRAAAVSKYVYLSKPVAVLFKNEIHHGNPVLKMRIKAYVLDIRYEFAFESDITERIFSEIKKEGLNTDICIPENISRICG